MISVGGTSINRNANNEFVNETAWGGSGSGPFVYQQCNESRPTYQDSVQSIVGVYRGEPDLTQMSVPGAPIFSNGTWTTDPNGIWKNTDYYGVMGGTSISSPLAAGILNSMNITKNNSVQIIHQTLYNWGPDPNHFRDITSGTVQDIDSNPDNPNSGRIFNATPGFDSCAGWGSLVGNGNVQNPLPTVTGINPNNGPVAGGTSVTITGTGLTDATAVNFGNTAATNVVVVSDSSITATSPVGTGTVDVTVTTNGGTVLLQQQINLHIMHHKIMKSTMVIEITMANLVMVVMVVMTVL